MGETAAHEVEHDGRRYRKDRGLLPAPPENSRLNLISLYSRTRRLSRRHGRICVVVALICTTLLLWRLVSYRDHCHCPNSLDLQNESSRLMDASNFGASHDTFKNFKYHGPMCNISSTDLYQSVGGLCPDRQSLLKAMSSGGRVGKDAPYLSRGCSYEWYTTKDICGILGRFSQIVLVGDSMLRHVIGAINILIREDLGYGGVTDWNFDESERNKCFCNRQFDVQHCSVQGIFSTEDVVKHDLASLKCLQFDRGWTTTIKIEQMVRYPMPEEELERLRSTVSAGTTRPRAFVLGHGLWNDLSHKDSLAWLDAVLDIVRPGLGHIAGKERGTRSHLPILLVTPNAAGELKPDEWLVSQGNKALMRFEKTMAVEAGRRQIDHLGTWNMSVQASLYDGVHMDLRGNLVKAMMVLNWLNSL